MFCVLLCGGVSIIILCVVVGSSMKLVVVVFMCVYGCNSVCNLLIFMCNCVWWVLLGWCMLNVWLMSVLCLVLFGYVLVSVCSSVNSIGWCVSEWFVVLVCILCWYVFIISVLVFYSVVMLFRVNVCYWLLCW